MNSSGIVNNAASAQITYTIDSVVVPSLAAAR
jgi:hypothetical protein